jgi:hypothetical protein
MEFGDHSSCKFTCTYIRYKLNKIIALNSILSKFANDNALAIINPFVDKSALADTLNTNLRKLLTCIARTKIDNISVCGAYSRAAAVGLMTIFQLIAELSPEPSDIEAKVRAIHEKVLIYDAQ